jgi:hypothetical protein
VTPIEAVHQLGWRVEGEYIILEGEGNAPGTLIFMEDFLRIVNLVTPQWRPAEWQQDTEILRKYARDDEGNVYAIDLPPLPG